MDYTTILYPILVWVNLSFGIYTLTGKAMGAVNIGLSVGMFLLAILHRMPIA